MTRVSSAREQGGKGARAGRAGRAGRVDRVKVDRVKVDRADGADRAAAVIAPRAAESIDRTPDLMAGPNPFVGLRPEDLVSTAQQIGAQCLQEPVLVLEQQAQLAQDLVSVLDGSAPLPSARDRRFGDPAWQDNPLYRMSLQGYEPGAMQSAALSAAL